VIAAIVEAGKLLEVVFEALLATVGIAAMYSLAVFAFAHAVEQRKRRGAAVAYGTLAAACALGCMAALAYGIVLTASK
jgi:hypothetical protein